MNQPRLIRTDDESIRIFLQAYDQYAKEVSERAQQFAAADPTIVEAVRLVNVAFCVYVEYLKYTIAVGFYDDFEHYESLEDSILRTFLGKRITKSKELVSLPAFDVIFARVLKMDMSNKEAIFCVQNMFVAY